MSFRPIQCRADTVLLVIVFAVCASKRCWRIAARSAGLVKLRSIPGGCSPTSSGGDKRIVAFASCKPHADSEAVKSGSVDKSSNLRPKVFHGVKNETFASPERAGRNLRAPV